MLIDRSSLVDLGIVPTAAGSWPLGPWLDGTHARPSGEALRRLLQTPLADVHAIRARQQLLTAVAAVRPAVDWSSLCALASQVDAYLSSNYVLLPTGSVALAAFAWSHGDIVRHVAEQVRAVAQCVALVDALVGRLRGLPPDPAAQRIVDVFDAVVQHDVRERLREVPLATAMASVQVARLDRVLREVPRGEAGAVAMATRLGALVQAVWEFDALCALAEASAQLLRQGGTMPVLGPAGASLSLEAVRHPLLPHGVANTVTMPAGERVLYLTGPNMAGKSTLLRTLGLVVFLAHRGMAVPAARAVVPWYDHMFVSLQVHDDLQRGESLYLAEVRRVRTVVEAVARDACVFAVFDEVFRGTNVVDASEATALLVDGLAAAPQGTFVIASHLAAVGAARVARAGVSCWCMEVTLGDGAPVFPYRVARGVSAVHLGMVLLDREGVGPVLRRLAGGVGASVTADPALTRETRDRSVPGFRLE